MRPTLALLCIFFFYAHLSSGTSNSDDRRWLVSLLSIVELEYQDRCDERATATWEELIGNSKGLSLKLELDKAFGIFSSKQKTDIKTAYTAPSLSADDDVLRRRVTLLLQPGDTLLETEQWIRLVSFADLALHKIRFASDYECGTNINCTLRELHNKLARSQDEETAKRIKLSWEKHLPNFNDYVENILPLARNASKENHYKTVEEYWDSLIEYEGAILKAREIWDNVKPLYMKLHKYVSLRLKGADSVGNTLSVTSLKSLTGEDWSNLIEILLPPHPDVYQKLYANLQLRDIGGKNAFIAADKLITHLSIGDMGKKILEESVFNGTCPPVIVDWCQPNKLKLVSCKDVSIQNYMDAHETAMKIRYKQTAALHSNNTYILREAPRFSAVYEAIPGFLSLLSLNPHALDRAQLYPLERFTYNSNHNRLVLQLIIALRDLPRLNYYLAADEWRLNVLMGKIPPSMLENSWSEFRRNFSLIESSNVDFLGDPYMLLNKPHVGDFLGLIVKYQIYQSYAEELMSDDSDLTEHVAMNNQRLIDAMMQGFGEAWPVLISDLLAKRENGLEYTGLTDYYRLLDEYLDNQLDPSTDVTLDEYVEPPLETEKDVEQNEISDQNVQSPSEVNKDEIKITQDHIHENIINTDGDPNFKFETSTVGVLEIKNPVPPRDQNNDNVQEASYNVYWWLGIAVALIIFVSLVAIIARKRHNHRKQLERQRQNPHP